MAKVYNKLKIFSVLAFLLMVTVNILANQLPINGMTTGEISANYPTLITPAGYTFLIWIVIYAMLLGYVVYQLEIQGRVRVLEPELADIIRLLFILSCILNTAWIFAWHYRYIALSVALILSLFVCLWNINQYLYAEEPSPSEKLFIRLPFSIYFGWVTVAAIVNIAVLLVSINWSGLGIPAPVWAIVAALIILILASYVTLTYKNLAYAVTIIWAYIGILVKHISKSGFNRQYPEIIFAIIICILILLLEMGYVILYKKKYGNH